MKPETEEKYVEHIRKLVQSNRAMAILHLLAAGCWFGAFFYFYRLLQDAIARGPEIAKDLSLGFWMGAACGFVMMIMGFGGTIELLMAMRRFSRGSPTERLLLKYHDELKRKASNQAIEAIGDPGPPQPHG